MEQEQVVAEWHGNQYRATVNHYGIAVIAANTQPVHVDDVELHRFDDDGAPHYGESQCCAAR